MRAGFEFDVPITRFGVYPGSTAATEPLELLLGEALVHERFGAGFDTILINLHFRHDGAPPPPFDDADIDRYHRYLAAFPKVTVRAKSRRIEIMWAMAIPFGPFAPGHAPSAVGFDQLVAELRLALDAARPRLAKLRDLQLPALIASVERTLASPPRSPDGLLAKVSELRASRRARLAGILAADPWAALGLDWTDYHPSARALLDDPFYWDPADDLAPVGNDTGADVLELYRSWRRRRRSGPPTPVARVERLLEEWGMSEAGDRADERVRDQAFVALAFAQAMLDGAVDGDVSARAMAAIDRQLGDLAAWPDPAARGATLEKVKAKLAALR